MITILHYIPSIDRKSGGTTTYMKSLADELGKITNLHVATHASNETVELLNTQIHFLPKWYTPISLYFNWKRLLKIVRPDIVHINGCWLPSCALLQSWAQSKGIKAVVSLHGMMEPWILNRNYYTRKLPALFFFQRRALQTADLIHVTAEQERNNFLNLDLNKKIATISIGINLNEAQQKKSYRHTGTILFISRIHPKKGLPYLIEAFAHLLHEPSLNGRIQRCIIAGEGHNEYIEELKLLARKMGVEKEIVLLGGVYGSKKWALIRDSDVLVLPTHSENFGLIVPEALACGTPVITTQGTPWEELVKHKCGWWTEIGTEPTYNALKEAMSLNYEELQEMGVRGRKLVVERYSSTSVAQSFLKSYEQLLS